MRTDIKFTVKEYMALPETGPRYQLVHGELVMSPSPTARHQIISARLHYCLYSFVERTKAGLALYAPLDMLLDDENVYQPDVLYISNARKGILTPKNIQGAPDLCVEILSPSNRDLDIQTKRVMYARAGVIEYWIVDPDANTLSVYRLQENPREPLRTLKQSETLESPLFPGLTIKLADVFAE